MIIPALGIAAGLGAAEKFAAPAVKAAAPGGFDDVLAGVAKDAVNTLKAGETAAVGGILGQTPINEVADAVMSAQRTLQAALSIRDKAVSAFQEITRMTI